MYCRKATGGQEDSPQKLKTSAKSMQTLKKRLQLYNKLLKLKIKI